MACSAMILSETRSFSQHDDSAGSSMLSEVLNLSRIVSLSSRLVLRHYLSIISNKHPDDPSLTVLLTYTIGYIVTRSSLSVFIT